MQYRAHPKACHSHTSLVVYGYHLNLAAKLPHCHVRVPPQKRAVSNNLCPLLLALFHHLGSGPEEQQDRAQFPSQAAAAWAERRIAQPSESDSLDSKRVTRCKAMRYSSASKLRAELRSWFLRRR